ncbi:MAG: hypothetical protein EXS05_09345 [Planctomycetaceae bacterium]|nr:hypothetical protein [Planctomycetaceae bacterium]
MRTSREVERLAVHASPGMFALWAGAGAWKMAPHLQLLDEALVEAIDDAQAGTLDGLAVSMPPQHGKSELCSKFLPAWYLATHPDRRVILVGYEADFAAAWGRKARDLIQQVGPVLGIAVSKCSKAAHRWDLAGRTGGMSTAGVGGPITGKGAHLLIIDDPVKNDAQARSATCRRHQWEWWQSVASTRLRPGGLTVIIQTRWHREDLTGKLLAQAAAGSRWRQITLPALAREHDPLERPIGEALWPAMYPREKLETIREGRTNYYWQALYQQSPISDDGAEWPDKYFGHEIWFDEWPAAWQCRVVALDPSKGTDAKFGDDSAFVMLVVDLDGRAWVDADLALRTTPAIVDQALEIHRTFRADAFAIEVNQYQQLLADQIVEAGRRRGLWLPVVAINNHVNKHVRIRRLSAYLAQGLLRFKGNSPGAARLVDELRDFPFGDHDDGPDALEMAVRLAEGLLAVPANDPGFTVERVSTG